MTVYVVLSALAMLALTVPLWWEQRAHRVYSLACAGAVLVLLALGAVLVFDDALAPDADAHHLGLVLLSLVAVVAGGPVTTAVLGAVGDDAQVVSAAAALRGGAWIGVLERAAVYLAIAIGSPEAIALVVAVKGLGRYPEIQAMQAPGAAERFIIGTLASILWASGCALVAVRLGP